MLRTDLQTPIFLTDATRGLVKSLDSQDIKNAGIQGVVVNTYHLMETPGLDVLQKAGGIKKFMNFDRLVVTDSGGWQIFSLIHRGNNGKPAGMITDEGVIFQKGVINKQLFTPEISIQTQFAIGSDIIICLDDFTAPGSSPKQIKQSVDRTILWAQRSKAEFEKICKEKSLTEKTRPLLFAVIQGDFNKALRKYCAEALIKIGFDGYGYGGYAIDEEAQTLDLELSRYIADLIPDDKYKFALGVGKPQDIIACYKMGWNIFDCTLPTRDARHKRLYVKDGFIYINKIMYAQDFGPIETGCDCHTCQNFSRAYVHHLFKIKEISALRLASIHNLRFYSRIIEHLTGD